MNIWSNYFAYFVLIAANLFGWLYNWLYEKFGKLAKMYTAFAVALGVLVVMLMGLGFVGLFETLYLVALFAAAGTPMIVGDVIRSNREQEAHLKEEVEKAKAEAKAIRDRKGPREWPNFAKSVRDTTAEELNTLTIKLAVLQGEKDPQKLQTMLAHTLIVLHTSLRRLESAGAPTQPPEL